MSDTNLLKSELEEICRGLGIPTEGTKADLIQKIKDFLSEGNREIPEKSDNAKRLNYDKELAQRSREKAKVPQSKTTTPNIEEQGPNIMEKTCKTSKNLRKRHFQKNCKGESSETLERKMMLEFKKLENAVLGFNDRLNSVSAQIQDTHQRVEINEAWPDHKFERSRDQHEYDILRQVGRELDLAMELKNVQNAINHIEDSWEKIANRMFTLLDIITKKLTKIQIQTPTSFFVPTISLKTISNPPKVNATSVEVLAISQIPITPIQMEITLPSDREKDSSLKPYYKLAQKSNLTISTRSTTSSKKPGSISISIDDIWLDLEIKRLLKTKAIALVAQRKCNPRTIEEPTLDISGSKTPFLNKLLARAYEYILPNTAYEKWLQNLWDEYPVKIHETTNVLTCN
ncbi:12368_t:CDS:2 [Dentiscutata erythropus]|uniref:12368_t:CDS:1 n=1 Tax=Dentiscutata erythropus TaxID=1348616 RepID=A0A9N9ANI9_9GLOM|nr:12368_t:CDS:2 [Dentiscutata erythropus]